MEGLALDSPANNEVDLLVINCGSSSLKAACFIADHPRKNFHYRIASQQPSIAGFDEAFRQLFADLGHISPTLIAHRFLFGGHIEQAARLVTASELQRLETLTAFAPLHIPLHLHGIKRCTEHFYRQSPMPQWACFDNAFHFHLPELAYRFPIPETFKLRRFGFHGLNYAHVAKQLPKLLDSHITRGRIVVAHLGSGCSLSLLENLQSMDTSMGCSTAGGIPMATRSGDMDPGVILTLAKILDSSQLHDLVFNQSGLHALSNGESNDMQTLLASKSDAAAFAVDYFARSVRAVIGGYAAKAGGIDALVFTGGIGEHAAEVRRLICEPLSFLGFELSEVANQSHQTWLSKSASKPILIIPADEEAEIASLVLNHSMINKQ
jgi:acetate kinase